MARQYRLGFGRRLVNRLVAFGVRRGWGKGQWLLVTRGRRTGQVRNTPVTPIRVDGERYLVAPYGEVGWVHNARAAGRVALHHGDVAEPHHVTEVGGAEAARVLQAYVERVPVVRPFFDAHPGAPLADFEAEAAAHPVFRLDPIG